MGDDGMIKIGPAGSSINGKAWNEKGRTKISEIFISHGNQTINSIQFQYLGENGRLTLSEKHGSSVGSRFDAVKLKPATEHITWISGRWGKSFNLKDSDLCCITFGTNHGEYGPFGTFTDNDKEFCFNLGGGKDDPPRFGGFYGTADYKLNSIGLYLNPNVALDDQKPILPRNK